MKLQRLIVGLMVPAMAILGCATSSTYALRDGGGDGGGGSDGSTVQDGGAKDSAISDALKSDTFVPPKVDASNCQGSGLTGCTPQSVCSFSPSAPPPPVVQAGVCTSLDVSNYFDWCVDPGDSTQCQALTNSNAACLGCLLTPDTAQKFGALISDSNGLIKNNIAGCFSVKGDGKCEGAVASNQQCVAAACPDNVCPVPSGDSNALAALNKCLSDSEVSNCATYQAVASSCLSDPRCTGADFRSTYVLIATALCVNGN